ncbi:MAG TPA: hypothetical protein VMQ67_12165 [Candidatus Saccharimonadales bacterium]|jgi:hypothetical protein|nr:hypothetical protein [Candidatus Saccharimonadales bacterium]
MKQETKLSTGQQQDHSAETQTAKTTAQQFENVEQLLLYDAAQTPVPPEIARRLNQSVTESPPPRRPWWRRIFG